MRSCERCGGSGVIERIDGNLAKECQCAVVRRLAAAMPAYVRHADARKEHFELPLVRDGVGRSYFVKATWQDMKAVVKAVMMINPSKFVKITSDRELRDVYVGGTSRQSKGDDADGVLNTLEDAMKPPALCIVRLGELTYKNKAAPGLLEEALCIRLDRDLPTWVVSDLDRPFGRGSLAYSDSVWSLIKTTMKECTVPRIAPALVGDDGNDSVMGGGSGSSDVSASPLAPEPVASSQAAPKRRHPQAPPDDESAAEEKPRRRIQPVPDEDAPKGLERYGMGLGAPKKFRGRD